MIRSAGSLDSYIRCFFDAGEQSERKSWEVSSPNAAPITRSLASDDEGVWKYLINIDKQSRVLEIGAGPDSLIHHVFDLGADCSQFDICSKRLAQSRTLHENSGKDIAVHYTRSSLDLLRSGEDSAFELILLNVPSINIDRRNRRKARVVYEALLVSLQNMLTKTGSLVVTATNRFSYKHKKQLFRSSASDARKATHLRAFSRAGFTRVSCYGLKEMSSHISSYIALKPRDNSEKHLVTLSNGGCKSWLKETILVPSFVFICNRSDAFVQASLLGRIIEDFVDTSQGEFGNDLLQTYHHIITRKQKLVLFSRWRDQKVIIKIPLNHQADTSERNNSDSLRWLMKNIEGQNRYPRSLALGEVNCQNYYVESQVSGSALSDIFSIQERDQPLEKVFEILHQLFVAHRNSGDPTKANMDEELFSRLIQKKIDRIFDITRDKLLRQKMEQFFVRGFLETEVPLGMLHGDFSVSNLLISEEGDVGLIDWETSALQDIAVLDPINYLDSVMRYFGNGLLVNQTIPALAKLELLTDKEREFLGHCFAMYGVDSKRHASFVYLRWLYHISYLSDFWLRSNTKAQQRYIYDIAKTLA